MRDDHEEGGGDPACWLDRVCPECGRFRDDPTLDHCPNCGTAVDGATPVLTGADAMTRDRDRDRDQTGRARNARPRDGLGRPLPHGAPGVARQPEGVPRAPRDALIEAQRLLDTGMPFHAHEVLEDAWKASAEPERELWRGLAQLAVALTHAARGNTTGAATLLRRAAENIAPYRDGAPHSIDAAGVSAWATDRAAELDTGSRAGELPPPRLRRG
jgi:hypothetical protein